MARILVDESSAFRHRVPQVANPYSQEDAGDRKLGTAAKGLALGESVATSKALGALLAGGMRLWDSAQGGEFESTSKPTAAAPDPVAEAAAKRLGILPDMKRDKLARVKLDADKAIEDADEEAVLSDMAARFDATPTRTSRGARLDDGRARVTTGRTLATRSDREQMREVDARLTALAGRDDTAWMAKAKEFLASEPTGTPAQQEQHRARQRMLAERLKDTPGFLPSAGAETETTRETAPTASSTSPAPREAAAAPRSEADLERRFPATTKPSVIMAYAKAATTPEAKARVMEMAAEADVYPSSLADLATGQYRRRFEAEVAKNFSKAGDDELLPYKKANIASQIDRRSAQTSLGERRFEFDQGKVRDQLELNRQELAERMKQNRRQIALGYAGLKNARTMQEARLAQERLQKSLDTAEDAVRASAAQSNKLLDDVLGPPMVVDAAMEAAAAAAENAYTAAAAAIKDEDPLKRPSDAALETLRRDAASKRGAVQRAKQQADKYNTEREAKRKAFMPADLTLISAASFGLLDDALLQFQKARAEADRAAKLKEIELNRR